MYELEKDVTLVLRQCSFWLPVLSELVRIWQCNEYCLFLYLSKVELKRFHAARLRDVELISVTSVALISSETEVHDSP